MDREVMDTWVERAMLAIVVGVLGFGVAALGGVRPSEFLFLWWGIIALVVLWIVRIWTAPKFRFLVPPALWAALPFLAYAIWRYRSADIEFVARQEMIHIALGIFLLFVLVNNLYSQQSTRVLCYSLLAIGTVVSMYAVYQWLRNTQFVWNFLRPEGYIGRGSGTYVCPNHLAGFLEMVLPIGVAFALTGRTTAVARIVIIYACGVMLAGIAATESRAAWLATGASTLLLAFLFLRTKGQRWIAVLLVLVITGIGIWFYARTIGPRVQATYLKGHERDLRLRVWHSAWQMWQDNFWFGVGPDHFDHRYGKYREAVDKTQGRPGRAHNDYLNTLADFGLVGFLLVLLPLGCLVWAAVKCWPHVRRNGGDFSSSQSSRGAIVAGASAGLVALLVHSFVDFNMHIPANSFVAIALIALILAHVRFSTERYWVTARWPTAAAATLILAVSLAYLGSHGITRTQELSRLREADKLKDGDARKVALLKEAFAFQPKNGELAFAVGEQLRAVAWIGAEGNENYAKEAMQWFKRAETLNEWDAMALIRIGMCLDWIGQHDQAAPYFARALDLEPNFYYSRAMMGWHEFQRERVPAAQEWFMKSLSLNWTDNPVARGYINIIESRMAEDRAGKIKLP